MSKTLERGLAQALLVGLNLSPEAFIQGEDRVLPEAHSEDPCQFGCVLQLTEAPDYGKLIVAISDYVTPKGYLYRPLNNPGNGTGALIRGDSQVPVAVSYTPKDHRLKITLGMLV